ncbi:MAG: Dabb family protein [Phycisphaerales bacterium]|nr:MAG: Dabb family protein [Phycisphaerales bacterium]
MTRSLLCLAAGVIVLTGCISVHETKHVTEQKPAAMSKTEPAAPALRHVVLFKFKDETTDEQVRQIEKAFCALPGKIDAIHDFEWGTDVSVENRQEGFTHCFLVTFRDEIARAEYIPHRAHKAFGKLLGPHLDKVLVIDYWTR